MLGWQDLLHIMSTHKIYDAEGVIIIRQGVSQPTLYSWRELTLTGSETSGWPRLSFFSLKFMLSHRTEEPRFFSLLNLCFSLLVSPLLHSSCFKSILQVHPMWSFKNKTFEVKQAKRTSEIPQCVTCFLEIPLWFPLASEFTCVLQTRACLWPSHTWLWFSTALPSAHSFLEGSNVSLLQWGPAHAVPWVWNSLFPKLWALSVQVLSS